MVADGACRVSTSALRATAGKPSQATLVRGVHRAGRRQAHGTTRTGIIECEAFQRRRTHGGGRNDGRRQRRARRGGGGARPPEGGGEDGGGGGGGGRGAGGEAAGAPPRA